MKTVIRLLFLTSILLFHSCSRETVIIGPQTDGVSILVSIGNLPNALSRGFGEEVEADNVIGQFRILAFNSTGVLAYNEITDISLNNPYQMEIRAGDYDFVFIGNEDYENNSTLTSQLNALVTGSSVFSDLENLSFPAKAFGPTVKIPMSLLVRNVSIVADDHLIVDNVEIRGIWEIGMKRLGVRLDLKITTESRRKRDSFSELHITNVPASVPILEVNLSGNKLYNGGQGNYLSSPIIIRAEEGDNDGAFEKPTSADDYEWSMTRIILPSSIFTPDDGDNAMTLECHYNNDDMVTAVLETGLDGLYQIPRNTHIKANAVITPTLELYLEVEDWDDIISEVPLGMNRTLNVSAFRASINEGRRERIWFSSNMPEVVVDSETSRGLDVNTVFKDLSGQGATNFFYDYDEATGEGWGYIDIMTSDDYNKGTTVHQIYLNANGLKREIDVQVTAGGRSSDVIGFFEYVGAFWRNDQVGERVITGASTGTWRAEIVFGQEWVVIGPGKSTDEKIYTNNPGDPEDFPVEGDETAVRGVGEVYFRLGAKSKNPNPDQPRYGLVRISVYNESRYAYIYLRQGEAADFLMRREDYGTSPSGATSWPTASDPRPRPLAAKIDPYNMTSQSAFASGYSTLTYQGGKRTDYPTQPGTFFNWGQASNTIYAYHPVNPATGSMTGWNSTSVTSYWNGLMDRQEICPYGYRRIRNGKIDDRENYGNVTVKESELAQSLWADPTTILNTSENTLYGYYADGFFDRHRINNMTCFNTVNNRTVVRPGEHGVGFVGCLFFNPDKEFNSSVFFPAPGYRHVTTGVLYNSGTFGHYWTATSNSSSGHYLDISYTIMPNSLNPVGGTGINRSTKAKSGGGNIRCVKKNDDEE